MSMVERGNHFSAFLVRLPLPLFGLSLGLAGLGNILAPLSLVASGICGILAALLWLVMFVQACVFRRAVVAEIKATLVAAGGFAAAFMSALILSGYLKGIFPVGQYLLWLIMSVLYTAYTLWFTFTHIKPKFFSHWYPAIMLPYAGLMIVSITAPVGIPEILRAVYFWVGTVCFFILVPLGAIRHIRYGTPDALRPTNSFFAGPSGVVVSGYVVLYAQGTSPEVLLAFAALSQFLFFGVVFRLPSFLRIPFAPSYAAFTFPYLIVAAGLGSALDFLYAAYINIPVGFIVLMWIEKMFAVGLTCYVLVRFCVYLVNLWIKTAPTSTLK